MPNMDIGRTLFAGTRAVKIAKESLTVGVTAPANRWLSSARPSTPSTRNNRAKISYAAVVLEYILTGRLNALEGSDNRRCFTELTSERGGSVEYAYHDGTTIHWYALPTQSSHKMIPVVLYALQTLSPMTETKEYFQKCCDDYIESGSVSLENLFHFCDAFYYEWKRNFPMEVPCDEFFTPELVQLTIRRGQLVCMNSLTESGISLPKITIEPMEEEEAEKKVESALPDSDKFTAAKRGDYRLEWGWALEQLNYIPELEDLDEYVPNESYYTLVDLIHYELGEVMDRLEHGEWGMKAIKNNYVNAILVGKPGTGKTTLANALAATFGLPVRVVAASKNAEEDTYQGMTKVCEGGFRFVETAFLDAYKNGGIILLEEFNLSDPAVMMGALGQAIEKPFILYEDGYKEVHRHPLCVIISTMNVATQGSREPSEAFTSRSPNTFLLDDPTEEEFLSILEKNGFKKKDCKRVYSAYCKIQMYLSSSKIQAQDVAMSLTLRHCLAALRQMRIGRTFKQALMSTLIGSIGIKDKELALQTYKDVVEPLKD